MYSVLTRAPAVNDVDVRWLKIYAALYGRDEGLTRLFQEALDNPILGPPVELSDLRGSGFHNDIEFFQCTLFKSLVREQGTYWGSDDQRRSQLNAVMAPTSRHQPFGLEQRVQLSQLSQNETTMDEAHSIESDDFPSNDDFYGGSEEIAACNETTMDDDYNGDSEANDVDMLRGVGSDESLSNDNHNGDCPFDSCGMDSEEEMLQREEVSRILKNPGGSYTLLSPKVAMIYDNTVTTEQGLHAMGVMDQLISDLMRMSFERQGASAVTGTVSLPTTNKRTSKHVRLRKASSPPRKKRATEKRIGNAVTTATV
jgi:hypothetical protein